MGSVWAVLHWAEVSAISVLICPPSKLKPGFSYKTNEYGLTVANVVSFEIVLPNGTVTSASRSENKDLFWTVRVCLF